MYTLVIIDMQPFFPSSGVKKVQEVVVKEIAKCKQNEWPIVLVETKGVSRTRQVIRDALKDYPKCFLVKKGQDDGSEEIHTVVQKVTRSKRIRVVGVNTDQCVYETVRGLHYTYGYHVTVNARGCNSSSPKFGLYLLSTLPVLVVGKLKNLDRYPQ